MTKPSPPGGGEGYGACGDAGDAAIYLGRKAFFNIDLLSVGAPSSGPPSEPSEAGPMGKGAAAK